MSSFEDVKKAGILILRDNRYMGDEFMDAAMKVRLVVIPAGTQYRTPRCMPDVAAVPVPRMLPWPIVTPKKQRV
jgi:hypothetical protein